jgi:putative peptide zinc metalloprotease protein
MAGSAHRKKPYLVRRSDGQTIQVTSLLYSTLEAIDGERGYDELADVVSDEIDRHVVADDVRYLVEDKLQPLGVLREADGSLPEMQRTNPLLALRFRFVVSDPELTRRITTPFAWLFRPTIALPVLVAFALSSAWVLFDKGLASPAHHAIYEPGLLLTVFALTLISAGFHEFGHAAACHYGGARPGAMGCGLYLLWPAFYTDVTDSYRLSRWGRLRVDLGGLYFNAVFGVAAFGFWALTGWDALLLVLPAQLVQMLRQLAPFIRADGYHIIADLVGVPDLFAHIKPTLLGVLPTHWRRPETKTLKWWARLVIVAWVAVVLPMLLGFMVFAVLTLPRLAATAFDSLGQQWDELVAHAGRGELAAAALGVVSIIAIALPVFAIVYLIWRVLSRTVRRVLRATEGRPAMRSAAALAGLAAAAFVAWAWLPGDRYEPIGPDERGAVQDVVLRLSKPADAQLAMITRPIGGGSQPSVAGGADPGAPRAAMLMIPRDSERPAILVLPGEGDEPQILTIEEEPDGGWQVSDPEPEEVVDDDEGAGTELADDVELDLESRTEPALEPSPAGSDPTPTVRAADWPFPFPEPPPPGEGDNRAYAVNTQDGTVLYDVAFSLVWVYDDDVEHWNEAWALASCQDCGTVAVAFQTILVVGRAEVVSPVNAAVSVNFECDRCHTWAIAMQLVVTLNGMPTDEVMEQIEEIWSRVEALAEDVENLGPVETYNQLKGFEAEILRVLAEGESVDATSDAQVAGADDPDASTTTSSTSSTTTSTTAPAPGDTTTSSTSSSSTTSTTTSPDSSTTTTSTSSTTAEESTDATTTTTEGAETTTTTEPSTTTTEQSTTTTEQSTTTTDTTEPAPSTTDGTESP